MSDLILLIVASFTCYRLSELIAVDDGPGDILLTIRAKLGGYDLDESGRPETSLGRAAICPYCVGIWIALGLATILFPVGPMILVWWLAIAGGQAFLQNVGGRV